MSADQTADALTGLLSDVAFGTMAERAACVQRIEDLFVFRQSGPQALALLAKMIGRTMAPHTSVAGWAQIKANGIKPLFDRERYPTYWDLPEGGPGKATLYQVDGTFVLLVLGSAASRNVALSPAEDPTEN